MFTDTDMKSLFRIIAAHPSRIVQPLPYQELRSGEGLVLEHHLKDEIRASILGIETSSADGRVSLLDLSSSLGIEFRKVEALLPFESEEWGRVGHSTIVRKSEFISLKKDLENALEDNVVSLSRFCREKSIDSELFFKLLRACGSAGEFNFFGQDGDVYGGKSVCRKSFLEKISEEFVGLLKYSETPFTISEIIETRNLSPDFIQHVIRLNLRNGQLKGLLKGFIFVSDTCRESNRNKVLNTLLNDGIIDFEPFTDIGAGSVDDFISEVLLSGIKLDSHIVTDSYFEGMKSDVNSHLRADGWALVKDVHGRLTRHDEIILRKELLRQLERIEEHSGHFVTRELKQRLTDEAVAYARSQGESSLMASLPFASLKPQDLQKHLTSKSSLPVTALSSLLKEITPLASISFSEHIQNLQAGIIANAKKTFMDKFAIRFKLHYMALQSISDISLRSKLAGDLLIYARDQVFSHLDKLDSVFNQMKATEQLRHTHNFRLALESSLDVNRFDAVMGNFLENFEVREPSNDDLQKKKFEMMKDMEAQIQKAKDPSLLMTMVLINLHAKKCSGFLKASGKYVPKLLILLKPHLEQEDYEDLVGYKGRILAKSVFTETDLQRLKNLVLSP